MPLTDQQVAELVVTANNSLQALQDEFGRTNVRTARIRFPRGFIRNAGAARRTLPNLGEELHRRNVSYSLIATDTLRWLVVRTDLYGAVLSMIIKEGIVIVAAICEWLTKEATRGHASRQSYVRRTQNLVDRNIIPAALKDELDWIWETRSNLHLHSPTALENDMYQRTDYNRAIDAYVEFRDILVAIHGRAT